jgi:hypothetical protein
VTCLCYARVVAMYWFGYIGVSMEGDRNISLSGTSQNLLKYYQPLESDQAIRTQFPSQSLSIAIFIYSIGIKSLC